MNALARKNDMLPETDDNTLSGATTDLLTVMIGGQRFGIPILQVQDVLGEQTVTKVPLAPPEVAGSLNLRGRIVTAIDVRTRLALPPYEDSSHKRMGVVVEHDHELYSLVIDKVGDVMSLSGDDFESNPPTLDPLWREVSAGIYRLQGELLVVLDIPRLLNVGHTS